MVLKFSAQTTLILTSNSSSVSLISCSVNPSLLYSPSLWHNSSANFVCILRPSRICLTLLLEPKILSVWYVKAVTIALGQHKLSLFFICVMHLLVLRSSARLMILVGLLPRGILLIVT